MMKGRYPLLSIQLVDTLSLAPLIFDVPTSISSKFSSEPTPFHTALAAASILHLLLKLNPADNSSISLPDIHDELQEMLFEAKADSGTRARLFLGCALTPYRGITYTDAKKKSHPACEAALREGLKVGTQNHYLDGIPALFGAWEMLKGPVTGVADLEDTRHERVRIGE
jgi:tRNA nucleotidyltransferase (CCA-adding enzyme)